MTVYMPAIVRLSTADLFALGGLISVVEFDRTGVGAAANDCRALMIHLASSAKVEANA